MSLKKLILSLNETAKNRGEELSEEELIKEWINFCEAVNEVESNFNKKYIKNINWEFPDYWYSMKVPFLLNMFKKMAGSLFSFKDPLQHLIDESGMKPNTKYLKEYL